MSATETCYQKSIDLLINNSSKYGVLASGKSDTAITRNYLSIFGRDASICSLGMIVSGHKKLINIAKKSLGTLAKYQSDNGQIPFFVQPEKRLTDFYYLGCIDSTLWWLIAIKFFDLNLKTNLTKKYYTKINKSLNWLYAQEHQKFYLLQQNEASDWADLMPRSGFVLYSNVLWFWVKKLYQQPTANQTKKYFNIIFNTHLNLSSQKKYLNKKIITLKKYLVSEKNNPCYLSFVNYSFSGHEVDVFGNILACLINLPNKKLKNQIVQYLTKQKANYPYPIKTVLKPIDKKNKLWRKYMNRHNNINKPKQYHNGGIWPFIGGFWILLLNQINKSASPNELKKLANINAKNNWEFNEWFHGSSVKPMGIAKQSWNAATYIMARQVINKNKFKLY